MTSEADRVGIVDLPSLIASVGRGPACYLLPADIRAVTCRLPIRSRCLRRQRLAGLLPDDVVGVPVRPVRIVAAGSLLVLAMRGGCASERGRKLGRRGECRIARVHAP